MKDAAAETAEKNTRSFIDILDGHLASEKTVLPPFDRTAVQIRREIARSEPDMARIERLIAGDAGLTSQLLRMANSAFYRGLKKVSTVRSAMVRLGTGEIANIVLLAAHRKHYVSGNRYYRSILVRLWRHSVGCAIGAHWLSKKCGLTKAAGEAFTAGLLHDAGKLFLIAVIESLQQGDAPGISPSRKLLGEVLESLHTRYGHCLLQRWNLPEVYCLTARDHHEKALDPRFPVLLTVRLANRACNAMGIGLRPESDCVLAATAEAEMLGLSEIALAELEVRLEDAMQLAE